MLETAALLLPLPKDQVQSFQFATRYLAAESRRMRQIKALLTCAQILSLFEGKSLFNLVDCSLEHSARTTLKRQVEVYIAVVYFMSLIVVVEM